MERLVILYFVDLTFESVGRGSVSLQDVATWSMVSKPTAQIFMRQLTEEGLLKEHRVSSKRGYGFMYKYTLTVEGKTWLDDNYPSAYELYRIHVAKVIAAIQAKNRGHDEHPMLTPKERRQIAAG